MLSAGNTNRVTEAEVIAVPQPEFTRSWRPVSHATVIDILGKAVKETGMEVVNKEYSITTNGNNMFGAWTLSNGNDDAAWSIGLRNSMQKTFAVGICAGTRVFVCDNLCFSGDFVEFRRHTSGLTIEALEALSFRAMGKTIDKMSELEGFMSRLHRFELPDLERKILTFEAMEKGVFPPSKFEAFAGAWMEERDLHGNTLYAFYGAGTRVMRGSSLFTVSDRSAALNNLCRGYMIN